jgi:hypothetical protein
LLIGSLMISHRYLQTGLSSANGSCATLLASFRARLSPTESRNVGVAGEIEHGAAMIHPRLGQPMRDAVGGGEAIISSNVKIGGPGTSIDVPLAHKDNIWSFDHLATMTISSDDAPRPDEIVVIMAISDGGRPHPRVGKGRV